MRDSIKKAIEVSSKAGLKNAINKFRKLENELQNQEYRVAVIGEFKTGKSTLINSMFIGKEILYVSHLEATAIPTEVKYGERAVLKVYPRTNNFIEDSNPEIFDNPTPEIIKEKTAGESDAEKQLIISSTSRAELFYKNENLRGLTVIDTPGINSNTQRIVDSVKEAIQDSDLILFVKRAKQFSNIELEFLRNDVFNEGVWRGAVLVNDDPLYADLDEDEKEDMIRCLKSQLHDIGRDHIAIRFIDFKNPVRPMNDSEKMDPFYEIFGHNDDEGSNDATNSSAAKALIQYLNSNKEIGRNIRLKNRFRACVNEAISECEIELEAMKLTPEELKEAKIKLAEQMSSFADSYGEIENEFIADLEKIQEDLKSEVFCGLNQYRDILIEKLDAAKSITDLQRVANDLSETTASPIRSIVSKGVKDTEIKILALKSKYDDKIEDSFRKYSSNAIGVEKLVFDPGFLKNLSEKLIIVCDYIVSMFFIPTGPISDIIIRYLGGKILPTPTDFVSKLMHSQFKSKLEKSFDCLKAEISNKLSDSIDKAKIDIHEGFYTTIKDRNDTLESAMNTVKDPARAELLNAAKSELSALIS